MKIILTCLIALIFTGCIDKNNGTAMKEAEETEINQQQLFTVQPPPKLSWSLERDNLIKRLKLQNDRSVNFYMYVFVEGIAQPVGYYMINKVSSVDSQLTNTEQLVRPYTTGGEFHSLPSPSEDGLI